MRKLSLAFVLLLSMILTSFSTVAAQETGYQTGWDSKIPKANYKDVETFKPKDQEAFLDQMGWEKPTPDAKLVEVTRAKHSDPEGQKNVESQDASLQALTVLKDGGEFPSCGTTVRARTSGVGDGSGKLRLAQEVQVSNTFNADVSVSAAIVSAGVGYSVTKSWKTIAEHSINTGGKDYQIVAYDDFQGQNFKVQSTIGGIPTDIGQGTSYRQVGFCFATYEI